MRGDQAFLDRYGANALLGLAVGATRDLVYVYDTDDRLVAWNERLNEVTGYSDDELRSMRPTEFVPESDRDALEQYVDESWVDGGRLQARLLCKDGSTIPYEFFGDRVVDDGELVGRVGIGRRVAERRAHQRRLERQNERLERAAALARHDLKSPLTAADGYLELARETGEAEYFERAAAAHDRIEEIVDRLYELTRPETAVETTETVPVGEAALRAWNVGLGGGQGELTLADPPSVEADRALLCQLLENLFRNAEEHTDCPADIEVGGLEEDAGFRVSDDGPGIPPDERDAVFEWGHSGGDGSGLGLALVAEIAEGHGWRVDVAESAAGGARFEIRV